jgi:hypothetical protein
MKCVKKFYFLLHIKNYNYSKFEVYLRRTFTFSIQKTRSRLLYYHLFLKSEMENITEFSSHSLKYYLFQYWRDFGDRRVKRFYLYSDGPYIMFIILAIYLSLVLKILPNFMKSRPPFKLQTIIQCYNIFLVSINAFYFTFSLRSLNYGLELLDFSIPSDEEFSPQIELEMNLFYFYFVSKLIDLMDTIFFSLRKKDNQITFLHIYHHFIMAFGAWLAGWFRFNVKPIKLFMLINSFIHTIMYSYYTLSTLGQKVQKYLWWKRYLTQLQLVQFAIFVIYGIFVKILDIKYPDILYYFTISNVVLFIYLFFSFYLKSYVKSEPKKQV